MPTQSYLLQTLYFRIINAHLKSADPSWRSSVEARRWSTTATPMWRATKHAKTQGALASRLHTRGGERHRGSGAEREQNSSGEAARQHSVRERAGRHLPALARRRPCVHGGRQEASDGGTTRPRDK